MSDFLPPLHRIRVVELKGLGVEHLVVNGVKHEAHVVVKNADFPIVVGWSDNSQKFGQDDIGGVSFRLRLLYNAPDLKPVDFVKKPPIVFKTSKVKCKDGADVVQITAKLNVLTSQHEDMRFRVEIDGFDAKTDVSIPGMKIVSGAIKVVSKLEHSTKPSKRKKSLNDRLVDTVNSIAEKQVAHEKLLFGLLSSFQGASNQSVQRKRGFGSSSSLTEHDDDFASGEGTFGLHTGDFSLVHGTASLSDDELENPRKRVCRSLPADEGHYNEDEELLVGAARAGASACKLNFHKCFVETLRNFAQLKEEEKNDCVKTTLKSMNDDESAQLGTLFNSIWVEGFKNETRAPPPSFVLENGEPTCECISCHHRVELNSIDKLYTSFCH